MKSMNDRFNLERRFRPEIEGLRIVAALLVAVYHIWFNRVSGGVDVFFVISGYLITTSIISKIKKDGYLSPAKYFGGLLKRLLPGALTVIGVTSLLSIFFLPSSITLKYIKETFASLFYYQNLQLAFSSTDYLDKTQMKTPLEHFWAMSIQGQFYIVWFLIFLLFVYILNKVEWVNPIKLITFIFTILFIASLSFSIYQTATNQQFAYFNPLARVWQFALGGLMCLHLSKLKVPSWIADVLGWIGLIGLILTGILFDVATMFPGIASLWPMLCAIMILLSGNQPTNFGVERLLSSKPFVTLGGISFGIYLWHWVLLSFYKYQFGNRIGILIGLSIIILSILLSYLMTKYIEKPLRQSKSFPKKKLGILYLLNVAVVFVLISNLFYQNYQQKRMDEITLAEKLKEYPGALAIGKDYKKRTPIPNISTVQEDVSDAYGDGLMVTKGSELLMKEYGAVDDFDKHILLVGGSHSSQWLGALQEIAKDNKIKITHMAKSLVRFSLDDQGPDRNEWMKKANNYIAENKDDIDLIFTQANVTEKGFTSMPKGFYEEFKYLEQYDIKVFAVKGNPRLGYGNHPIQHYEQNKDWQLDVSEMNNQEWKDKTLKNVKFYDYNHYITPNDIYKPVQGNVFVYFDEGHMTDTYVRTLAPIIKDDVLKELDMK
ncbi:acyltransferase family protein [Macrococcoides canis]|uniref:acyltransferase family protein n=1 Tax=Macrococcoides canis TaxID=1855823 RepID=UPI0020B79A3C|nr:acyltransferase family protein [Macrococcus canis]